MHRCTCVYLCIQAWKLTPVNKAGIKEAETVIIRQVQAEYMYFSVELKDLKNGNINRGNSIVKPTPYHEGVLRICGRAGKATALTDEEKHPVIMPKCSRLVTLIVALTLCQPLGF